LKANKFVGLCEFIDQAPKITEDFFAATLIESEEYLVVLATKLMS
jgi:hypothetical protein